MGKKGKKSIKGQGELWDEVKIKVTIAITPTALSQLDSLAKKLHLSRSELIEQLGRGVIPIGNPPYLQSPDP